MTRESERWFSVAYGIWLLGISAYFIPAATWNPVSRFDLTRAIVEQHTFSIDAYADDTGDRAFSSGRWYTDKAPIPSVLAVPAYASLRLLQEARDEEPEYAAFATRSTPALRVTVNGPFQRALYVCTVATAGVATALLGVLLFHLLRRRFSRGAAFFASAGTVLGTPLLPYATSFYGHDVAAAFLVVALFALFGDPQLEPSRARVRLAGAAVALAAGSEYLAAIPGLVIVAFWLGSRLQTSAAGELPRRSLPWSLVDLSLGGVLPALFVAGYHAVCFGSPLRTGYSFIVHPEFSRGHASGLLGLHLPTLAGLYGLLFSPFRGLFFLAPFTLVAALFGLVHAIRARDVASRAGMAAFAALLLVNAGYYMWWGGAAAGPRHLVPVIGFLSFGLARAFDSRARWLTAVLVLVSVANFLALTAVGLEAPDHGDALFDYAYRRLFAGDIAWMSGASNIGIRMGLARAATLGPLLVWLLLGGRFLLRRLDEWVGSGEDEPAREPRDSLEATA